MIISVCIFSLILRLNKYYFHNLMKYILSYILIVSIIPIFSGDASDQTASDIEKFVCKAVRSSRFEPMREAIKNNDSFIYKVKFNLKKGETFEMSLTSGNQSETDFSKVRQSRTKVGSLLELPEYCENNGELALHHACFL